MSSDQRTLESADATSTSTTVFNGGYAVESGGTAVYPYAANAVTSTISVQAGAGQATFNLELDANAASAPSSYISGWTTAATLLSEAIADPITVNIEIGYTEYPADNSAISAGWAYGGPAYGSSYTYTELRHFLSGTGASDVISAINALPSTSSLNGVTDFYVASTEEKAFGQIAASATAIDGYAGFGTGWDGAIVGGALHEFTHAMGRIPGGSVLSLFRYTGSGTHDFSGDVPAASTYFSTDGGATVLANFGENSDPSDFLNNSLTVNDPFDEVIYTGANALTSLDRTMLDMLGFGSATISVAAGSVSDFDGDGRSDVLWHDNANGDTGYWTTDSNGAVTGLHDYGSGSTAYAVVGVGDFDGDGKAEALWYSAANADTGYWTTDANGTVTGFYDYGKGSTAYVVAGVGDFDGSGRDEVLWHNDADGDTGYWATDSSGTVTGFHDYGERSTASVVAGVGDFDGNGRAEVLWHDQANGDTGYWTTDSNGTVTGFHDYGNGSTTYAIAGVGDFDGKGRDEVLWQDKATGDTGYWATDSNGNLTGFHDFGFGDTTYAIAGVGDYNGDGRSDVLWHNNANGDTGYWMTDSNGTVTGFHDYAAGSPAYQIVPS